MKQKVSVIVPVYNVEQYICQAVDSILAQTYPQLEVILVDDGSPDNSGTICDEYAASDPRVRVIHKENGGVTSARKAGINAATGSYLIIVDGDDWIEPDLVECCLDTAMQKRADCVLYSYIKEYPSKSIPVHLFDYEFHYEADEAATKIQRRLIGPVGEELRQPQKAEFLSSVCLKFYRTEIARQGRFVCEREVGTNEDGIFNLYAMKDCSVSYVDRCFYHYRKTNVNSITTRYKDNFVSKWDIMYGYLREYVENAEDMDTMHAALLNRMACGMITLGLNEIAANTSIWAKARSLKCILKKEEYILAFHHLDTRYCPIHWKLFFILCRYRLAFLLAILLIAMNYLRARMSA